MSVARPSIRIVSLVALVLVVAAPFARAQGSPPAPARSAAPEQGFVGHWRSDADSTYRMTVISHGFGMVTLDAPHRFDGTGYVSANEVVALLRRPPFRRGEDVPFETGVLRLERLDPTTLRASFSADLHGAVTSRETWTLEPEPGSSTRTRPAPAAGGPDHPAFGEYVYVTELPEALVKVTPVYPEGTQVEGQVLVQALVGTEGLVMDTRIVKSIPELDAAAVACVRQWRFKPALSEGKPTAVWVAVPVQFSRH